MELNARINRYFDRPEMADALAAAIGRLVRIPSMKGPPAPGAPYGPGPAAVLEEALALCRDMGFSARSYDGYVGLADLNDRQTRLHILGHLDVVAAGTGWTATDPFAPKLDGGMLYGRGVADDKGPVVAALFAMKAARDLDLPLKANVRMIMGLDEESGSSDIAYYYAREPYAPYTFSPDADFPLIHVEKGHYHPDFAARWAPSAALPRVAGLEGGIRANVVPPRRALWSQGWTGPARSPCVPAWKPEPAPASPWPMGRRAWKSLVPGPTPTPPRRSRATTQSPLCWPCWRRPRWPTAAAPGLYAACTRSSPMGIPPERLWASPSLTGSPGRSQ